MSFPGLRFVPAAEAVHDSSVIKSASKILGQKSTLNATGRIVRVVRVEISRIS
jgi:hypothetical protein